MAYSEDFKKRVIAYKDSGHTFAEVLEAFGVYHKSYYAWKKQIDLNGKFTPGYHKERKRKIDADKLAKLLDEHPDWYLGQFAEVFNVWPQSIQKRFARMGITRKKKTFTYSEKSEEKREAYIKAIAEIPAENRVYVDECGINEHLLREYGRARRGVKVEDTKRGRKYHRVNVVAAVIHSERGTKKTAPLCYHGSMNAERFEQWMTFNLIPALESGQTIIMDNASFHRKKQLKQICETAGVSILFLPPYSPDFNPIEKDWSNMKRELRDTAPLETLLETAIYNYWR